MKKLMKLVLGASYVGFRLFLVQLAIGVGMAFGEIVPIDVNRLGQEPFEGDGYRFDSESHLITLLEDRQFVLSGVSSAVGVLVTKNVKGVMLDALRIENREDEQARHPGTPIRLEGESDVVFTLKDANTLVAAPHCAAIEVPRTAKLAITADDDAAELTAVGGRKQWANDAELQEGDEGEGDPENRAVEGGAGIGTGANPRADCGMIVILRGRITATGGERAAGIGGGDAGGCAGNIEIRGGTVTATGGWGAAGIGSGYGQGDNQPDLPSCDGKIVISGGRVTAQGGAGGAGVGGGGYRGGNRPKGPDVQILGGTVSAAGGEGVKRGKRTVYPWDFGAGSNPDDTKLPAVIISGGTVWATSLLDFNQRPRQSEGGAWVSPVRVELGKPAGNAKVEVRGLPQEFGVRDLYANEDGDLHFYFPVGQKVFFSVTRTEAGGDAPVTTHFWAVAAETETRANAWSGNGLFVNGQPIDLLDSGMGWRKEDVGDGGCLVHLDGTFERYVLTGAASNAVICVEKLDATRVLELKDLCLEYGKVRWPAISFESGCGGRDVRLELNGVSYLQGYENAIDLCDGLSCEIDATANASEAVLITCVRDAYNRAGATGRTAACAISGSEIVLGERHFVPKGSVALRGGFLYAEGGGADYKGCACAGLCVRTNIVSGGTLRVLAGRKGMTLNPPQPSLRASEANIFTGGSVLAGDGTMPTEVAICVAPTNGAGKAVHRVTVPVSGGTDDDPRVKISGIPGYGGKDIVALDGKAYLYLPDGDYRFTVNGRMVRATVDGADTETTDKLGFTVNGTDVTDGSGEGWAYNAEAGVLAIVGTGTYVLSGGAMYDEVAVNVAAPQGPTVILSNAVIFAEGRPALNVAQGATLAMADGQVMMAGDAPESMRYTSAWAMKKCVLVGPGATVTVKDIPHVKDVVVSNAVEAIQGTAVTGGTAYRVLLGDDVFVCYTVEEGYFSRAENPLRYAAVGGDIIVSADAIPVAPNLPYRAWNPDTRRMEDRTCSGYEVVTENTATFEDGKWYAVTNAVQRGMITVKGSAHLILCDGANLTLHGGGAGLFVGPDSAISIYGQTSGTGELVATSSQKRAAGIGGVSGAGGTVTIDGGRVTAHGATYGAGIGGSAGACRTVTINGGVVSATGGNGAAGIGGYKGAGGAVTINGGTVTAEGGQGAADIGRGRKGKGVVTLTIDGGSVKASTEQNFTKNSAGATLRCVTAKVAGLRVEKLRVEGLGEYGTNDIYPVKNADGEDCVYLRLPAGNRWFTISDGQTTHRYFAAVKGIDITVQPLPPAVDVGFFVNGADIGARAGEGWTYGKDKILSLDGNGTYVLSGLATNNEAQVKVTQQGTTVVLSNAVVFTSGRAALDVAQGIALQMAGGASFLAATDNAAAVSVAGGAALAVGLAPNANRNETMIGVFNDTGAAAVAGQGTAAVEDGTFFVWSDHQAIGLSQFKVEGDELMQTGDTPEEMRYTTDWASKKCVLVGPSVTVTVKNGIPHVTGFTVSNAVETIRGTEVSGGTDYRVMLGDDVFVGYTLEEGYLTDADNPLVYASVEGNVTVDESTIPTVLGIPYRDWNAATRQMEDKVCVEYEIVTADTATFEDGKWYVVRDSISRGMITVNGAAHLILCDGAKLTARSYTPEGIKILQGKELTIYGQKLGTGELEAKGGTAIYIGCAGIGSFFGGWRLTVNGGRVTATGGANAAGIGGSHRAPGGDVTINGGTVTATGSRDGAGIGGGGGHQCDGGTVTINGGTVTATGGTYGAGIGGGAAETSGKTGGSGGTVTINGGMVTATGGYDGAGIGGGYNGGGGTVKVTGGTVTAKGGEKAVDIGHGYRASSDGSLTIDGGSVKANAVKDLAKNSTPTNVYCVTVKCPGLEGLVGLEGLGSYGTNDIYAVEGKVYLWLPKGTYHFTLSDGTTTNRYCAVVKGRDITVEPLGPVGFFVNGEDIGKDGIGDGWHYQEKVLTLDSAMTYVLSGGATNDEVQVKAAANGATVVLSNAVVFASGRPALDVTQNATLQMAGGTSYLAATNESAAVLVAEGAALTVGLAPNADWKEAMIGVFNYGKAKAIAGSGAVAVTGGSFFAWADEQAVEVPGKLTCGEVEVMMTGKTPETLAYATSCTFDPCILVAPAVTVTVKNGIPHVTGFAVSNGVEAIQGIAVSGGTAYRVLFGDDVFVHYTVEAGYLSEADNPLRYVKVNGDIVVDSDTIPVIPDTVSYIDRWSGRDETVVVTGNYVFVDADLTTLASGVTYVVAGTVTNRNLLSLSGPATLVVSDGATLVAEGGFTSAGWPAVTNALSIHGQTAGDGLLFAKEFRGVDTAVHGVTTVTDGIFGGQPVFLGGTVSANVVSNGQLMAVAGGNICIENRFAFAYDGGERAVHAVICPVPGVTGRVTIEGLAGYCTGDIFPVDGVICLYLPEGEHVFTVNGVRMRALVLGDGTIAERDVGGYLAYGRGGELLGAFVRLTNAVHAAKDGGTVKLTNDCHEAGAFVLPEGAAVTLDGCGYRLTLDATDFNAPSALVSTNAALCLTNIVLTRSAVSRTTGLVAVADRGALEMLDCAITNCDASVSSLISVADGGFRASGVWFDGNTASTLVEANVRSADARFEIANWSATGNVCDELFAVGNLSGLVDACEIGAGEQSGNTCRVADLVVGSGAACLRGAPPLARVRLAGFAMIADALHSHLAYRDALPQGGVVVDVSSPDMRLGSVIVSNAFGQAVSPQAVDLVTPGCRVAADASGSLRLEQAWARPFIVRTVSGVQTNYVSYASAEEAISHGGRDLLLMSYEESGSRHADLSGNISVPDGEQLSLDTVRLTVTTNENWTAPSPDPVTLDGIVTVPTNSVLWLGNVLPREIVLDREASVLVEARPPQGRYLYFRFTQNALDHILADGGVVASTCLTSLELRDVCAVLNEGYALVPADTIPEGLRGALWLIPTKYHEAWIEGEDAPRPSFIGAMESANDAVGATNVTMYAVSYTNETDGSVIGGYSSKGREITVGGTNGTVRLTVGSKRIRVEGTGERTVVNPPIPLTKLDLGGSTLRIRTGSVLALADVDVTGAFTLAGEGVLNLQNYLGTMLTVRIDPATGGGPRKIVEGDATGKIQLASGQKGELFVKDGSVWWQLGVTCEYEQINDGKVKVTIRKNGNVVKEEEVEVKRGKQTYTYWDGNVRHDFTLMAVFVDWADERWLWMYAPNGTLYEAKDGSFKSFGANCESGVTLPSADIRIVVNKGLKIRCKFPQQRQNDIDADSLTDGPDPDPKVLDLSILSEDDLGKMGVPKDEDLNKSVNPAKDPNENSVNGLDVVLATAAVNGGLSAAGVGGSGVAISFVKLKKLWTVFGFIYTMLDFGRSIVFVCLKAHAFINKPLLYKGRDYRADAFTNLCASCATDNGSGDKGNSIFLRHAIGIDPIALGTMGFAKMDGEFTTPGREIPAALLLDVHDKLQRSLDGVSIAMLILDIIVTKLVPPPKKFGWASVAAWIATAVTRVAQVIEAALILSYRFEYPLPPLGGSLALSSGVKYDFAKMKFDANRKSRYLRALGDNSPEGRVRTAPILVVKPGATSEFDTCELRNFKYSSPSGLIYACSGATLVLKDFIVAGNTCTNAVKTPPIVAEKGATVWVCGKSDIEGIEAVGADLRIGYGPHGDAKEQARELTGTGTINVFGETGFGAKIGTATFSNETSKALSRIVSQQYSRWVSPVFSNEGGALTSVWKEKSGVRSKLEPITFKKDNPFSVSVTRSGAGNTATVTGGLEVPTKEALEELPLVFEIISMDSLRDAKGTNVGVTVNKADGTFKREIDKLGNSHFFRLKYKNKLEGSK